MQKGPAKLHKSTAKKARAQATVKGLPPQSEARVALCQSIRNIEVAVHYYTLAAMKDCLDFDDDARRVVAEIYRHCEDIDSAVKAILRLEKAITNLMV